MANCGHKSKVFIITKTPFYLLEISKRTNKKYLCNRNSVTHFH